METEATQYEGDIDEETYNKTKTASKILSAAGAAVWVMGDSVVEERVEPPPQEEQSGINLWATAISRQ